MPGCIDRTEFVTDEVSQLFESNFSTRLDDDTGDCDVLPFRIRNTDDGNIGERGMSLQELFDRSGPDVLTAGDDEVITSSMDHEQTVRIDLTQIASSKESAIVFRISPVA